MQSRSLSSLPREQLIDFPDARLSRSSQLKCTSTLQHTAARVLHSMAFEKGTGGKDFNTAQPARHDSDHFVLFIYIFPLICFTARNFFYSQSFNVIPPDKSDYPY